MDNFSSYASYNNYIRKLKVVTDKDKLICKLCESKDVLDIGCIDHSYKTALELGDNWLHNKIKGVAKSLTGIDILEEDVGVLNNKGFNIKVADAENFRIDSRFDVINAGDVIEHLSNLGNFLDSVRLHLKENGLVIITTPNPFNIEQLFSIIFYNNVAVNEQHTVWIDPRVMWELTRRHQFRIVGYHWIETRFKIFNNSMCTKYLDKIICPLAELFMKFRPLFQRDYCVILKSNDTNGIFNK